MSGKREKREKFSTERWPLKAEKMLGKLIFFVKNFNLKKNDLIR